MEKLILGCGYLGLRVARHWQDRGHRVHVMTRQASRTEFLRDAGLLPFVGDVTADFRLPEISVDTLLFAVGFDRSAGHPLRDVYVGGLQNLLNRLADPPRRIIYISSTGVYGQNDGGWVDEESSCAPQRAGGRACLEAERLLAAHPCGQSSIVLRLAGIYGPDRIPLLDSVAAGEQLSTDPDGYLNLIHVADAVSTILSAESLAPRPSLFNVADGCPIFRAEFYRKLAELIGAPPPEFASPNPAPSAATRGGTLKRVSNQRMIEQLQVKLQFPSYEIGLAAIVNEMRERGS